MFTKILILTTAIATSMVDAHGPGLAYHGAEPYKFGYSVKDHHGEQHREESGDGHSGVKGSYGFTDDRGVHRQVNYVADHGGFRAQVKTNEPGTANQDPAAVHIISSAHAGASHGYGYGGHGGYGYGGPGYAGYGGHGGYGYGGPGYAGYGGHGGYGYGGPGYAGYGGHGGHGYGGPGYAGYGGH